MIKINPQYTSCEKFLNSIPEIFETQGKLLHDGRNKVKAIDGCGRTVIVKRFKKPNIFGEFRFFFTGICKASKGYKYAERFARKGVDTPVPIAYITNSRFHWLGYSYLVTERCPGQPVDEQLTGKHRNKELALALAADLVRMHDAGVQHGDLNLSNIFWRRYNEDGHYEFAYIDINRTKFPLVPNKSLRASSLMRLTHDRDLLKLIADEYGRIKGYDVDKFTEKVMRHLDRFERKKRVLALLRGKRYRD